jgi:hypothetical protein
MKPLFWSGDKFADVEKIKTLLKKESGFGFKT